jgi:hypothetical protein
MANSNRSTDAAAASKDICRRHPASCSRSIPMICSSLNLDRFTRKPQNRLPTHLLDGAGAAGVQFPLTVDRALVALEQASLQLAPDSRFPKRTLSLLAPTT